jgi:hypothetical protein
VGAPTVTRIVGTAAGPAAYGADFRPRRRWRADEQRFRRVQDALDRGVTLPPVALQNLGYGYYVVDGLWGCRSRGGRSKRVCSIPSG